MKKLNFFILGLALTFINIFILAVDLSAQTLNDNGSTHTINANGSNQYSGSAQDYTIPSNPLSNTISFTLRGGDGGYAEAGTSGGNPCRSNGGEGATVEVEFLIGNGANELQPGGDIRFIVGKSGINQITSGSANTAGAGGGGTAVLYRPNSSANWIILAAAGGGGGAHQGQIFGSCIDSQKGQGGRSTENGGDGEGASSGSGGTNGHKGEDGSITQSGDGGSGAYSGNNNTNTGGYPNGCSNYSVSSAGRGGWGFGAGGNAPGGDNADGGGGGGGYSGGGGGATYNNGGGGGSYVNSSYAISSTKTAGSNGGGNSQNGHVDYTFENTIITWTGAVSHDWHNSGNWSPARVPTSLDIVHITSSGNPATILDNATASTGLIRVLSGATLTLQQYATLNVSPYGQDGMEVFGTLINNGIINISPAGGSCDDGIAIFGGVVTNTFGAEINIEGMNRYGIWNTLGSDFNNQAGATINIGTTSSPNGGDAIQNESGASISNLGTLNIQNTNGLGIENLGSFYNQANGLIKIKQTPNNGIRCIEGTFNNNGEIRMAESGSIGSNAIYVDPFASFKNNAGSSLSIWGSGNYGIYVAEDGLVENAGDMTIGGLGGSGSQGNAAIATLGTFNNKPGGAIAIDQTSIAGILNSSPGYAAIFNNEGDITIGAVAATGGDGIQNQGTFNNLSTGTIEIVQTGAHGIYNATGSFINEGLLKIGENGSIANAAIRNGTATLSPVFSNNSCTAAIHLFAKDIDDAGNSFTNNATILKESTGSSNIATNNGLILVNAGTFTVDNGNAALSVSGSFSGKKIWTGCNGGTAWEDPNSWAPYGTPTTADEVVIYPTGTDPVIGSSAMAKSVRVRDGGHLYNNGTLAVTDGDLDIDQGSTVEGDGQYTLSGHFTVNGGTFIPGTSTVTMTGTVADRAIGFDPIDFYNLIIDKPSDISVRIFAVVFVHNEMIINSGDLEVVGALSGILWCPFLHLPAGTDLYNYTGGFVLQYENSGSIWIQAGASLQGDGSYNVAGDFIVDGGTFSPGTSSVLLNGSGTQTISQDPVNFYDLYINKASGEVVLDAGSVTVSNELHLIKSDVNLNGTDLELTGNGTIIGESALSYIYSTNGGVVKKTLDLNAPADVNPGNIGATITSSANLGSTTIQRGHEVQDVNGEVSIERYYDISPANNSGLDATVRFSYLDHELNGIAEDDLTPVRFTGTDWNYYAASASDGTANWVETENVDDFSIWTLAEECELLTFYADADGDGYTTGASEVTCVAPAGYRLASELVNTTDVDCNDGDASVNPNPDCSGTTRTWTGYVSTDWDEACNWSPNCVPTTSDEVIIPDMANDPMISGTTAAAARSVTVETDAQLTIITGGSLTITADADDALVNSGTVNNAGNINIGEMTGSEKRGIYNTGLFTNEAGAVIYFEQIGGDSSEGIDNRSTFSNYGLITVQSGLSNSSVAIQNLGTFDHYAGGEIIVHQAGEGIFNDDEGNFTNYGIINLGLVQLNTDGLDNRGIFTNYPGATLTIDNAGSHGIYNHSNAGEFLNGGEIRIGSYGTINYSGIYNRDGSTFTNETIGKIYIDNTQDSNSGDGIYLSSPVTFTNRGVIHIGSNAPIADYGITSLGTFTNMDGGLITIDRAYRGIFTQSQPFTNRGDIIIGEAAPLTSYAIWTFGTILNNSCATIQVLSDNIIKDGGTITNDGLIIEHASGNSNISINNGIVNNLNGGTFTVTTNNEIIVEETITTDCSAVSPAFGLGASVDLNIVGIFTGPVGSPLAGSYDVVTNTFTPNDLLPQGLSLLYVQFNGFQNGCTLMVEWPVVNNGNVITCYLDSDGDTFGDPANSQEFCDVCGTGYVADNTDCDDEDANEFPGQTWYIDADGDLYGGSSTTACERPENGFLLSELNGAGTDDCDDEDANEFPGQTWYIDADGDLYGGSSTTTCERPEYGFLLSELSGTGTDDCDDEDPNEFPGQTWYIDADGDLYGGSSTTACERPENGFLLSELNGAGTDDCDDEDANEFPGQTWYIDADGDLYGGSSTTTCERPEYGFLLSELSGTGTDDCDDEDANEFPGQTWFIDADGDTYGGSAMTACERPENGFLLSELSGTGTDDCSDNDGNINPSATEVCDGIDNDCDGLIDNDDPSLVDNTPPTAVCLNFTVQLDDSGSGSISVLDIDGGSSDACGIMDISLSQNTFDCSQTGDQNVVMTVTDVNNNVNTCNAIVTVEDNVAPELSCSNVTVELSWDNEGNPTAVYNNTDIIDVAEDACGLYDLPVNSQVMGCEDVGSFTQSVTVLDVHGNANTCSATVTVVDGTAPTALCQNTTIELDGNGSAGISVSDIDAGSWDYCGIQSLQLNQTAFDCDQVGANTVSLTATDKNGNTASCNATVWVVDNIAPTAVCENITIELNAEGMATLTPEQIGSNSFDNCYIDMMMVSQDQFDCSLAGATVTVQLEVFDQSGNSAICKSFVTISEGDALPVDWDHEDIGTSGGAATYSPCDGLLTVQSYGYSQPTSDKQHFAYTQLCGDGEIIAQVVSVTAPGWAGVQMRENNSTGSKMVRLKTQLSNFIRREVRAATNGYAINKQLFRPQATWLKLVRSGNNFQGYSSTNGTTWQFAFAATIAMNDCIEVGLFSESFSNTSQTTAVFDNVSITPYGGGSDFMIPETGLDIVQDIVQKTIEVYPNPASQIVNVNLEAYLEQEVQLEIFDNLGRMVFQTTPERLEVPVRTLDLPDLKDGTYWITVRSEASTSTKKLVIVR